MEKTALVLLISNFVQNTPSELILDVMKRIRQWETLPSDFQIKRLLATIQNPRFKENFRKIIDCWIKNNPEMTPIGVCFAIETSLTTFTNISASSLELIWTGPALSSHVFRRTDQALLELIQGAKNQLLIVSFAVYKVHSILEAIEAAICRNVNVSICLEDLDGNQGKIAFSGIKTFSDSVFRLASFYTWPIENRPRTVDGKFGSLHAKIAVADRETVYISSANLTDYAMDLNIEMGVLLKDSCIGEQISNLFDNMILNSVFQKYENQS